MEHTHRIISSDHFIIQYSKDNTVLEVKSLKEKFLKVNWIAFVLLGDIDDLKMSSSNGTN